MTNEERKEEDSKLFLVKELLEEHRAKLVAEVAKLGAEDEIR